MRLPNTVRCLSLSTKPGTLLTPLTTGWLQKLPWLADLDMPDACNPSGKAEGSPTTQQKVSAWCRGGCAV